MNAVQDLLLLGSIQQGVAQITLNRPKQRNPLDWSTVVALRAAVKQFEADSSVQVVIVRGSGGNFSAGGDLKGYVSLYRNKQDFRQFLEDFYQLFEAMENSAKIYVAVIDGYCVAGGLELLLACDVVVAAHSANIGDGHVNFGQLPGAGGSQRLPRAIGPMRARYLMTTGELINATEAERIGLVSKVVADEELDAFVGQLGRRLASNSPLGLQGMKHLVNHGLRGDLNSGLRMEIDYVHDYATNSNDATEGLIAFGEKRKPLFTGTRTCSPARKPIFLPCGISRINLPLPVSVIPATPRNQAGRCSNWHRRPA